MKGRTWTAREWLVLMVLALAPIFMAGCGDEPLPNQTTIVNINTNTNTINIGESGAKNPDAVEGSVTADTATVTITGMADGENCPPGILKANTNGKFRLGCTLDITVNPRNANGDVIHDKNAPNPDAFLSLGPDSVATFTKDANPYNGKLRSVGVGSVKLVASVNGKAGEASFEVIP